jgi:hypothetical protein
VVFAVVSLAFLFQAGVVAPSSAPADTGQKHAGAAKKPASARGEARSRKKLEPLPWPRLDFSFERDDLGYNPEDDVLSREHLDAMLTDAALETGNTPTTTVALATPTKPGAASGTPRSGARPSGGASSSVGVPAAGPAAQRSGAKPSGAAVSAGAGAATSGLTTVAASTGVSRGTPRKRVKAITYSDAYAKRLTIHRIASYAMPPMFIAQYITGSQLIAKGRQAPGWALHTHGPLATLTTAIFSVNTVTGVWNLWEARKDPAGRTTRWLHGLLLLTADAGFTATGILSGQARNSNSARHLHRAVALSSMGVAMVGYVIMLPPFRK